MAEQTAQLVSNEMRLNGNVDRVFSTFIVANPESGVRGCVFTYVGSSVSSTTLTQKINEAYDEDAEREDEEFFRTTKAYYRHRFSTED